jgi:SPP1 family predicted phage head-tail adaptor
MQAGKRDQKVAIQHLSTTTDDYGGEIETWTDVGTVWAQYVPGTGSERRQAAQESASLPATFRVLDNPITRAVEPANYRLSYDGALWDVVSSVRLGRDGREITAVRAA